VAVPGTVRAPGSCPAGCQATVGLWWWRQTTPHQPNGGSRWQDLPICNSSFCPRLRSETIAELNCQRTLKAQPLEKLPISSSAAACWRRSAPLGRSRSGDAMTTADRWRFASPRPGSKRSASMMWRWPLPRKQAFARLLPEAKSKHLRQKPSPLQQRSPRVRRKVRARRRPTPARGATAGRARNKLACSRCWADRRERRLLPSCARPIGSSIRSAASSRGGAQAARPRSALGESRR
jgi:hypothetical protein